MRAALATVQLAALTQNLARARTLAPKARVMAIVKADGYGHGLERVARALSAADAFGVACIEDAERLRGLGMLHRIVLLAGFDEPADLRLVRSLKLDCVLHDPSQLQILQRERGAPIRVWLKFDTGMHRLGFPIEQAAALCSQLREMPSVAPDLHVMSHFASADAPTRTSTEQQMALCLRHAQGLEAGISLANSAALLAFPQSHQQWVRPGGILYGLSSFPGRTGPDLGFVPAMTLSSKLIAIKQLQAGDAVGYGGSFIAPQAMRIGIAAIGYGDGYPRHAASGTPVLVDGQRCGTVGRVSMDLLAIDLTAAPRAQAGSSVVLWGPKLPAELVADAADTISYELTCGVTRRVRFAEI